ncbi:hypothetical protein TELCIR_09142 [Teladorsagia circumcincta]|uniref:Phytanoyl-CoA hydroxylase-interacting protein-like C-terminal domain-containing protein n=1 Tax=Teladorsagia circumcincta TaxID=45464 RepID=A0A2G9UFM2_TELCI|nr:hypothetical protein TELCIR_09142 [Teladorsagia circumcincta]
MGEGSQRPLRPLVEVVRVSHPKDMLVTADADLSPRLHSPGVMAMMYVDLHIILILTDSQPSSTIIQLPIQPHVQGNDCFAEDIRYLLECTDKESGRKWVFDQSWTQTQRELKTTPGNTYWCKPREYWDEIHHFHDDLMEKYIKDNNGQPANRINGIISGLFFSARVYADGSLPTQSPFGNVRMMVPPGALLNPVHNNFYFADFYCNYYTHYVTVVICRKGSETDE